MSEQANPKALKIDTKDEQALWEALRQLDIDDLLGDDGYLDPIELANEVEQFEVSFKEDGNENTSPKSLLVLNAASFVTAAQFNRPDDDDPMLVALKNRAYALAQQTVTRAKNMGVRGWIATLMKSLLLGLGGFSAVHALSPFDQYNDYSSNDTWQLTESQLFESDTLWVPGQSN